MIFHLKLTFQHCYQIPFILLTIENPSSTSQLNPSRVISRVFASRMNFLDMQDVVMPVMWKIVTSLLRVMTSLTPDLNLGALMIHSQQCGKPVIVGSYSHS